jgi:hypothetical protein
MTLKKLKQLSATVLLALMLGASVHAGDMNFPPAPPAPPPDHITSAETSPTTKDQGIQSLAVSDPAADVSIIAFNLLCDMLSMY